MKAFAYYNASDLDDAIAALSKGGGQSMALAGGTDLLGEMKNRYVTPERVVNLKSIRGLDGISYSGSSGLKIGPLARLSEVAQDKTVRQKYPGLAEAAESVGTPQLRNMGTMGGNLCQRPRCWYYRGVEYPCIRKLGGTCYAVSGRNKYHCILDGGPCFIVHPSDVAPMLMAYRARLTVRGRSGEREVAMDDFFVLPEDDPTRENILQAGELVTGITVPPQPSNTASCFLKFKERESRDFALVSAAVVLELDGQACKRVSIVLGGVSPVPHRAVQAEQALNGKVITGELVEKAAEAALADASPMDENEYKVPLSKTILKRAVLRAAGVGV
jgi:xanthine dehydrogenase YagS FAD-binding subunit